MTAHVDFPATQICGSEKLVPRAGMLHYLFTRNSVARCGISQLKQVSDSAPRSLAWGLPLRSDVYGIRR